MEEDLISVVVPVYNVSRYLNECLDSLLSQTYSKIEIILVEDGSTDNCSEICDEYARVNSNVRVIHKKNEGLGFARNSGLDIADGEYVVFVDSDDTVSPSLVMNLYNGIKKYNADLCKSGFNRSLKNGKQGRITRYDDKFYNLEDVKNELLPRMVGASPDEYDLIEMSACACLYKMEIIRDYDMRFPSERKFISEDLIFNINFLKRVKCACTISAVDYIYRMNEKSLTHSYRSDRFEAVVFFYETVNRFLVDCGYGYETLNRLKRTFFSYTRMSIAQESYRISGNSFRVSLSNVERIINNTVIKEVVSDYPIHYFDKKQKLFIRLLINNHAILLTILTYIGLV